MLFSSSEVAEYVNATFEPVWESVRPAPLVTIDFGNGHVVRRTLQGNVATYVCNSDGTVYDVLPGIYTPDVYREQLKALKALADSLRPIIGTREEATATERLRANWTLATKLRDYHKLAEAKLSAPTAVKTITPEFESLAPTGDINTFGTFARTPPFRPDGFFGGPPGFGGAAFTGQPITPQVAGIARTGGAFKGGGFSPPGGISGGSYGNFGTFGFPPPGGFSAGGFQAIGFGQFSGFSQPAFSGIEGPLARVIVGAPVPAIPKAAALGSLADRPELKLDTEVNERIRRKAVHAHLAPLGLVQPADIKKWLFKEVLHADLDDPKLGLGPLLDSNYPFAEEDRVLGGKK